MQNDYYSKIKDLAIQLEQDLEFYRQFSDELECNKEEGIVPRALFLEKGESGGKGCIFVGLNPGTAKSMEIEFVKQNSTEVPILFSDKWYNFPYHNRLRNVMRQLDYTGDILWTELVKCQSKVKGKISLQAIRKEFKQHLQHEISAVPDTWLIVGVGNQAYELLAKLYPDRTVLGLHHPTGSYSFSKLFSEKDKLNQGIKDTLLSFLEKENGECKFLKYRKGQFILE